MYVLLMYDIAMNEEGAKIQRNVFKICKKYLIHIQMSVFEGKISKPQLQKLHYELNEYIREDLDSLLVFKSRNQKWMEKEFWGKTDDATDNFF